MQKAENHVRDCNLAIAAAESVLLKAKSEKGFGEFNVALERKAMERASDYACDAIKSARQDSFKAGARGGAALGCMRIWPWCTRS